MQLAPTRSSWLGASPDCARTAFYSAAPSGKLGNTKAKKLQFLHTAPPLDLSRLRAAAAMNDAVGNVLQDERRPRVRHGGGAERHAVGARVAAQARSPAHGAPDV
jgi:hypothetical protein